MKTILAAFAVLLLAAPVRAIELSLEENRAESGSVGFVDMQRLFDSSPDAQKAKEGFQDLIRQAEERVNLRKAELLKLGRELDASRAERAALAAAPETPAVPAAPAPIAASTAAAPAPADVSVSTPAAPDAVAASSAPALALSTGALALPGMTPDVSAPMAPPSASSATAPAAAAPVAVSSAAAPTPAASAPPKGKADQLLALDAKILALQAEIASKETELSQVHDGADKDLLAAEGRKTDRVLARLYRAIGAVAKREGVSVVIDKSSLLYGHPAMDLTDKVLAELERSPAP